MTASLPPALVPAYLATLSVDIRACAVLDSSGGVVAGDPALGGREELVTEHGEGLTVVVEAGPLALAGLVREDLRRVVAALCGA